MSINGGGRKETPWSGYEEWAIPFDRSKCPSNSVARVGRGPPLQELVSLPNHPDTGEAPVG
jgi:hypothetical protein